ncbi:MAG: GTPase domain-containing protein [Planctomycetia bacterium]|nr:GTPase domain-containing protein [Planctomycetia bacterium]
MDVSTRQNTTIPFAACAAEVRRLAAALAALEQSSAVLQIPQLSGREWYESLRRKLIPQLADEPYIVAAVVGGTNIGKSVVFNHLAGGRISASSPLASGTRHPVCLVPAGFETRHDLSSVFQGFSLSAWTEPDAALEDCPEHRLFWKSSPELPPNLLVLDSPDIDSDAEINWLRADHLRHCADVLVAVLTQQKYNDAAVKRFFRKAAGEDKAVIVVFNQCQLPEDEQFWPLWLDTFSRETGVVPDLLYIAPNDRRAAESNRLPFYERPWPPGANGQASADSAPHDLARDLSGMRFHEIKFRTLRGALAQLLSPQEGAPAYLDEVRLRSASFQDAARLLSKQELIRIDNWPAAPVNLVVTHIREWWRTHRSGWTRTIHDVYGTLGSGLLWPFRWAKQKISGEAPDPRVAYRESERKIMLLAIDTLYSELTRLSQLGNDLLRPRLEALLAGASRAELLAKLAAALEALDVDQELSRVVGAQMQLFREENPSTFGMFRKLDAMAAAFRPMTSVVSFAYGGVAGDAVVTSMAHSMAIRIMGDIGLGTGAVVVGETALLSTAGGLRLLEARFRQLQASFTTQRAMWFAEFLHQNILGDLHAELSTAAGVTDTAPFAEVASSLAQLNELLT